MPVGRPMRKKPAGLKQIAAPGHLMGRFQIRTKEEMRFLKRPFSEMSFKDRLANDALLWGVPILLLELIGAPWDALPILILVFIPCTAVGVIAFAVLEHWYVGRRGRHGR